MKDSVKHILWGYAFLLVVLSYVFGLFIDLTGDSGLYAAIVRQMLESGNWFTLKINGQLYDQKPHLLFWLAGIGVKLFGYSNFAFKFFPTLWAWAGIYFTYQLGKVVYSKIAGRYAALITGTSQIFMLYLFDVHTDTILLTGVIFALWQLAVYLKSHKTVHFILGFVGVGLAMFSKGPVGAVVPFFFVFFYLLFQKDYRQIFRFKWILGIFISLFVTSPALIYLYRSFGVEGIRFFFITNNFGRISGEYAGSSTDYIFYLHTILWAFLPWIVFVVFAFYKEIRSWFSKKGKDIWGISLLGSVLVFTAILSVAKGKAPNYFLLAIPVISVVTGKWLKSTVDELNEQKLIKAQRIFLWCFGIFFVFLIYVFRDTNIWLPIVLIVILLVVVFISRMNIFGQFNRMMFFSALLAGSINLFLTTSVLPRLFAYQGARQALQIFEKNKKPGDKLYNFEVEEYELFFMAKEDVTQLKDWNYLYDAMEKSGSWVYTNSIKRDDIIKMGYDIDTIYQIPQRGMNRLSIQFLNPESRNESLKNNFLIKTK